MNEIRAQSLRENISKISCHSQDFTAMLPVALGSTGANRGFAVCFEKQVGVTIMKWNMMTAPLRAATVAAMVHATLISLPAAHAAKIGTEYAMAVVQLDDLELSKEKDVERLLNRVKRAARDVCTPGGVAGRYSAKAQRMCYEATLRKAMADVDRIVGLPLTPLLAGDSG